MVTYQNKARGEALVKFLETVDDGENPFCIDGRSRTGITKAMALNSLTSSLMKDDARVGFDTMNAKTLENAITKVLDEIPKLIESNALQTDASGFYNVFKALRINSAITGKSIAAEAERKAEMDAFNVATSIPITSIFEARQKRLKEAANKSSASSHLAAKSDLTKQVAQELLEGPVTTGEDVLLLFRIVVELMRIPNAAVGIGERQGRSREEQAQASSKDAPEHAVR